MIYEQRDQYTKKNVMHVFIGVGKIGELIPYTMINAACY